MSLLAVHMPRPRRAHALRALALLAALCLAFSAEAQAPQAAPTPSSGERAPAPTPPADDGATVQLIGEPPETLGLGETATLRLRVRLPEGAERIGLRPAENPFVEAVGDTRSRNDDAPTLSVAVFRPGTYTFRAEALWVDSDGAQRRTRTEPITLHIPSITANEAAPELAEAGPILALRSRNLWLIGLVGGLGIAALLAAVVALWRRLRPTPDEEVYTPPPRPAWELALEEIAALRSELNDREIDPIESHHRISEILRRWVERRYHIRAPEMTTYEIVTELNHRRLALGQRADEIQSILEDTDLVKFAKFAPPLEGAITLLDQVETLVRAVKRDDEAPPAAVPAPLEGAPEEIVPAVAAAPQAQTPGAADATFNPAAHAEEEAKIVRLPRRKPRDEEDAP